MSREFYVEPERPGSWVVKNNGFVINRGAENEAVETARRLAFSEWRNVRVPSQVHVCRPDGRFRTDWVFGDLTPRYP
jgi:hypothetical protein